MRLTINLDDDLYAMARSHAIATKTSISKAVGDLLRRKVAPTVTEREDEPAFYIHPISGFPVVKGGGKPITNEDIQRAMDDEILRYLEPMGLTLEDLDQ